MIKGGGNLKRKFLLLVLVVILALVAFVSVSYAYTPLISSADFAGIQVDVTTAATGVITVAIIVLGVFLIIKAMS